MISKNDLRFRALVLLVMGSSVSAWSWYIPFHEDHYSLGLAGFGPMIAVIGATFLFLPIDETKLRESGGPPYRLSQYPMRYKILVGVAIAAGIANMAAVFLCFSI